MSPLKLCKYYSPEYKGEYNLSFFDKKELYFQRPSKFNDPWDCKAPKIVLPDSRPALKNICIIKGSDSSIYNRLNE